LIFSSFSSLPSARLFFPSPSHTTYVSTYPNAQFASTGTGIPISSSTGTHFQYCPFLGSTSGNFPFGTVPKRAICQYWYWAFRYVLGPFSSGTVIHWAPYRNWTLCVRSHFRYGALPVPVRSFTGPRTGTGLYARGPISCTGLCQFRYGPFYGPVRRERKRFSLGFGKSVRRAVLSHRS
jgi:hypothetical protein